jgi:hypothetical protein
VLWGAHACFRRLHNVGSTGNQARESRMKILLIEDLARSDVDMGYAIEAPEQP